MNYGYVLNTKRFRLDSEYYKDEFLKNENLIKTNRILSQYLLNEEVKNVKSIKLNKNFNYLEISRIDLNGLNYNTIEIDYNSIPDRATYILRNKDIVVSTVRPNRNAVAFIQNCNRLVGTSGLTVLRTNKIIPEYLFAFCKTKYFVKCLMRENTATMYPAVSDDDIYSVNILIPDINFQFLIKDIVNNANNKLIESKNIYEKAEQILLKELNLNKFIPPEKLISIKSFKKSFLSSARLDAEYYQPKYDEMEKIIKKYSNGYCIFGDNIKYIFTGEYSEEYYLKDTNLKFYIRSLNIRNGRIEDDENYYVDPGQFSKFVKKGDIITARVGTLGVFGEVDNNFDGSICSDNVLCFHLPDNFLPDVYTLYLNTKINSDFIERLSRGSVQQRLNQETLKELLIPIISGEKQKEISNIIKLSQEYRDKSKQYLNIAVKSVEIAIEESEEKAIIFLNQNEIS